MQEKSITLSGTTSASRFQDIVQLTKLRLSSLVVFSAAMGYLIASGRNFHWYELLLVSAGGFLVTGASNAFNQIIEKEQDRLMNRTMNRPLPAGRMTVSEAFITAVLMALSGIFILWVGLNPLCGILSFFSLLLYVIAYTPMKRVSSFSVLVGAFPGAFPPLLGWVAARNEIGLEALVLFSMQFIWQFPHFWAIAWVLHDDYSKAGFRMLPVGTGRTKGSAFQTLVYTICLVPMGLLPLMFGFVSGPAAILMVVCGMLFTVRAIQLYTECSVESAQKLMFASFIYLPVTQMIWVIDKLF